MKRILLTVFGFLIVVGSASAAVTVTPATGGGSISADTNIANGSVTWTALTGPVAIEGAGRDIPASGTFILNAPSGFSFNTGSVVTATITRITGSGSCFQFNSNSAIPTASTITYTVTARDSNNSTRCQVSFSGIRVRPNAGTPLASGNITNTGTNAGFPKSATNYGTLNEIAGTKNILAFTTQPSATATSGVDFVTKPIIVIHDKFGNTVTSDNTSAVTLTPKLSTQTCTGTNGAGVLSSTPTSGASVTAGTMTYTAMQYSVAESIKICATSPSVTSTLSNAITINSSVIVPTKFVITSAPDGTVDAPVVVTIEAQNNAGVVATTYQSDVTLLKSGSATGGGLVNIVNGVGTTTISDTVAETVLLTLSDTQGTGLTVTSSADIIFSAGATAQLFLNDATSMTAGTRALYTVTRKDQFGNLKTDGSEIFYLSSDSGSASKKFYDDATAGNIVTSVTIQNGTSTGNAWYYDELAGSVVVTVSDNSSAPDGTIGVDDASDIITIEAGVTAQFTLSDNVSMIAGERSAYTVTRKDQFGNAVAIGSDMVYLSSDSTSPSKKFYDAASGGNVITSLSITNGASTGNAWYYDELAGSVVVTVSDNATSPDGNVGIDDATDAITVTPASTGTFLLSDPGNMTVGTRLQYTVSRKDSFGNTVTTGTNTIYLYSDSTGSTKAFYDAASGGNVITSMVIGDGSSSANIWYYDEQPGTWTITASDNTSAPDGSTGIVDGTDSVIVNAAPIIATKLVIVNPTDDIVGNTVTVTIRAEDNAGSLDTTYNGTVTLTTGGQATPQNGVVVTITNGLGSTNITDTVAETVSLTLTDTGSTGLDVSSTQDVTFSPAPTAQLFLNNPGNMIAGERSAYTVTRKDQFGNLVTAGADTVYFYTNSTGGLGAFYDAATNGSSITSVTISQGASTASLWYYEGTSGSWTVTASDNASAPDGATGITDGTDAVTVSPASTAQYILNDPGDMTAGTRLEYTVTRKDQFGNLVTAGAQTVYLYANPASTSSAFYNVASGGSPVSTRTIQSGASSAMFWYYDEAPSVVTITASDNASAPDGATGVNDASDSTTVSAIPIVATQLVIVNPTDALVGTNVIITVRAEDNNGNVDTTFNNTVTLVTSGSATGGGVVTLTNGVGTKTITDATAETVLLTLLDTGSTGLLTTSAQDVLFSTTPSAPVVVSGGGSTPIRSTVIFSGKAFPGAKLTILGVGEGDIPMRQGTVASSNGTFTFRFGGLNPGLTSYFLSVADKNGKTTQTKAFRIDVDRTLIVKDVFLPPTISFIRNTVTKGGFVGITGYATPGHSVQAIIDGKPVGEVDVADETGKYMVLYNTYELSLGTHVVRTYQTSPTGETSDSSTEGSFTVSLLPTPQTDLNSDGVINASDLSIFLSKWLSKDPSMRGVIDFNGDGKIDIQDLSIFARTLPR